MGLSPFKRFRNFVTFAVQKILLTGTQGIDDPFSLVSLIICNTVAAIALFAMVIIITGFAISQTYLLAIITLLTSPVFFLIFYLNSKRMHKITRLYTSAAALIGVVLSVFSNGVGSQLQLTLLAIFPIQFLILMPEPRRYLYSYLASTFLLIILIDINPGGFFDGLIRLPTSVILPLMLFVKSIVLFASFIENKSKQIVYDKLISKEMEILNLLNNMHQAVFTIDQNGAIQPGYSKFSSNIFKKVDLVGYNFIDDFLTQSPLSPDDISQIRGTLTTSSSEPMFSFDLNKHLLPKKICFEETAQYFEIDWIALLDEDHNINNFMINIRDVTIQKKYEQESEIRNREIEIIRLILDVGAENFRNYLHSTNEYIRQSEEICQNWKRAIHVENDAAHANEITVLFRNLHTIKGNSRLFGFSHIVDAAHLAEQSLLEYKEYRNSPSSLEHLEQVLAHVSGIHTAANEYADVFSKNLENKHTNEILDIYSLAKNFEEEATDIIENSNLLQRTTEFIEEFGNITAKTIDLLLENQIRGLKSVANSLEIPIPELKISHGKIYFRQRWHAILQDSINHIFRNSLDHGLRNLAPNPGVIYVTVCRIPAKMVEISIRDSGSGLAIREITARAIKLKLIEEKNSLSPWQIANCIFLSGFSTKNTVTDISGRGIGMDFVKATMNKNGGEATIDFVGNPDPKGFQPFQILLHVPEKWVQL